jgi:coproporphyrinogen III oxidase
MVAWSYNRKPKGDTPERELYEKFLVRKDWV